MSWRPPGANPLWMVAAMGASVSVPVVVALLAVHLGHAGFAAGVGCGLVGPLLVLGWIEIRSRFR